MKIHYYMHIDPKESKKYQDIKEYSCTTACKGRNVNTVMKFQDGLISIRKESQQSM